MVSQPMRSFRQRPASVGLFVLALLCVAVTPARASTTAQQDPAPYTLHVYTNLVQIPTLILDPGRSYVPKLDRRRVIVNVDSGVPFQPIRVRRESDDPITLAILVDTSGAEDGMFAFFPEAMARIARLSLQPDDRVMFYALDCSLVQVAKASPPDPELMKQAVQRAIENEQTHGAAARPGNCEKSLHIDNALIQLAHDLQHEPGRRVILAITEGIDRSNESAPDKTIDAATSSGVAIFGLSNTPYSPFETLCEQTGGLVRHVNAASLNTQLSRFVQTVRDRYIVEFQRPPQGIRRGKHNIAISVLGLPTFVRPGGTSVTIADPCAPADKRAMRHDHATPRPCVGTPPPGPALPPSADPSQPGS